MTNLKRKKTLATTKNNAKKAELSLFRPQIRSRHPSHHQFRTDIKKLPFKSVVRLGSTTPMIDDVTSGGRRVECNTVKSVEISSNKLLMKQQFQGAGVKTPKYYNYDQLIHLDDIDYPIVMKHIYGSRGSGNYLINNREELDTNVRNKNTNHYIFENYFTGSREYRLHVTEDGCFYTCRKMLKRDTPSANRWYRNDSNCVWILEENPLFDTPVNWEEIEADCVRALKAVGLDIGACDVRVQSAKDKRGRDRENPEWSIIEINSAPSMGEITAIRYKDIIPVVLIKKYNKLTQIRHT